MPKEICLGIIKKILTTNKFLLKTSDIIKNIIFLTLDSCIFNTGLLQIFPWIGDLLVGHRHDTRHRTSFRLVIKSFFWQNPLDSALSRNEV